MIFIILAMLSYTVALLFITAADRNLNIKIATAIINGLSALIPVVISIPLINRKTLATQRFGLIMAVLGGTFIALFGLALGKSFSVNKVGVVTPVVFGGAIVLSTILSTVIFKEKIRLIEAIGLTIMTIGISIVIYSRLASS